MHVVNLIKYVNLWNPIARGRSVHCGWRPVAWGTLCTFSLARLRIVVFASNVWSQLTPRFKDSRNSYNVIYSVYYTPWPGELCAHFPLGGLRGTWCWPQVSWVAMGDQTFLSGPPSKNYLPPPLSCEFYRFIWMMERFAWLIFWSSQWYYILEETQA